MSASNLAKWLAKRGHDVGVLAAASKKEQVLDDELVNGIRMWRVHMPRQYPMFDFPKSPPKWKKAIWHLQDHVDPRNKAIVRDVLAKFKPDIVSIHIIQGIGHNALNAIAEADVPVIYFLHDLGLACIKESMFKNGRDCEQLCTLCKTSCSWKARLVSKLPVIGFCSPSQANMDTLAKFFPLERYPHKAILNANRYPPATASRTDSSTFRVLYVGRIHSTKGVDVLLQAVERLVPSHDIQVTLVGDGPDLPALKARYTSKPWCRFTGFLSQAEISNHMVQSDVLCTPSIWAENSPGVVIHALSVGLPVIGSRRGGIPELVSEDRTGSLIEPGNVDAWARELERLIRYPDVVKQWRTAATENASRFDQDNIGQEIEAYMLQIAGMRGASDSLTLAHVAGDES